MLFSLHNSYVVDYCSNTHEFHLVGDCFKHKTLFIRSQFDSRYTASENKISLTRHGLTTCKVLDRYSEFNFNILKLFVYLLNYTG